MKAYLNALLDLGRTDLFLLAAFAEPEQLTQAWLKGEPKGSRVPLHAAAVMDNLGCAETLVTDLRQDINEADAKGWTALHHACQHGSARTLTFLVSHGANLNATTNHGATPLHVARLAHYPKLLAMMVYMGANLEAEDAEGSTPIQTMARGGDVSSACVLAKLGADAFKKDRNGQSAMRIAKALGFGHHLDNAVQDWRISSRWHTITV